MNRHSRKNACQKSGKDVPEEVPHGGTLLSEDVPHAPFYNPNTSAVQQEKAGLSREEPGLSAIQPESGSAPGRSFHSLKSVLVRLERVAHRVFGRELAVGRHQNTCRKGDEPDLSTVAEAPRIEHGLLLIGKWLKRP